MTWCAKVKKWVLAEWKISANNRRARFYRLTTAGKKQLGVEESRFSQMFGAIMRVMKTTLSLRGASPLGLPYTLSREPLRRLAPFA